MNFYAYVGTGKVKWQLMEMDKEGFYQCSTEVYNWWCPLVNIETWMFIILLLTIITISYYKIKECKQKQENKNE